MRIGFRCAELRGETQAHVARYNFGEMLIAAKYGSLHAVFGRIGEECHGALGALGSFPLAGEVVQAFGGVGAVFGVFFLCVMLFVGDYRAENSALIVYFTADGVCRLL